MSDNIEKIEAIESIESNAKNEAAEKKVTESANKNGENIVDKYSIAYALDMIERIAVDTEHIHRAIETIGSMENEGTPCGGSAEALAKAAADVVRCRETTSQKLIEFYGKMVDDLKKSQAGDENEAKLRKQFLDFVRDTSIAVAGASLPGAEGGKLPDFEKLWKTVFLGK